MAQLRNVLDEFRRREIDDVLAARPARTAGDEAMAAVLSLQALHCRPQRGFRKRVQRRVYARVQWREHLRVITVVVHPALKGEARRCDELEAIFDRIAAITPVQERIDESCIDL